MRSRGPTTASPSRHLLRLTAGCSVPSGRRRTCRGRRGGSRRVEPSGDRVARRPARMPNYVALVEAASSIRPGAPVLERPRKRKISARPLRPSNLWATRVAARSTGVARWLRWVVRRAVAAPSTTTGSRAWGGSGRKPCERPVRGLIGTPCRTRAPRGADAGTNPMTARTDRGRGPGGRFGAFCLNMATSTVRAAGRSRLDAASAAGGWVIDPDGRPALTTRCRARRALHPLGGEEATAGTGLRAGARVDCDRGSSLGHVRPNHRASVVRAVRSRHTFGVIDRRR